MKDKNIMSIPLLEILCKYQCPDIETLLIKLLKDE